MNIILPNTFRQAFMAWYAAPTALTRTEPLEYLVEINLCAQYLSLASRIRTDRAQMPALTTVRKSQMKYMD